MLILFISALFLSLLSATTSYAYWANSISGSTTNTTETTTVGTWDFTDGSPEGIDAFELTTAYDTFDMVWYNNQIYINYGSYTINKEPTNTGNWTTLNDLNWYSTVTYRDGDIVYHDGIVYEAQWETTGSEPTGESVNGVWTSLMQNNVAWVTGQATSLNGIVYHEGQLWMYKGYYTTTEPGSTTSWALVGNLAYSSNYVYADGDVTLYNGTYYTTTNGGWASSSTPGTNSAWTALTTPTWSKSIKNGIKYVLHNGLLYKAVATNYSLLKGNEPGTSGAYGVWTAINTQTWQQYNTYAAGDLTMYNSNVYELENIANSIYTPGTAANSWNIMNSMDYVQNSTYVLNEYAIYNGLVYQVVNVTNANSNLPGTAANAWNLMNGYQYQWFNTYQTGDIVLYNNVVYVALSTTTNHIPGATGSSAYWAINS